MLVSNRTLNTKSSWDFLTQVINPVYYRDRIKLVEKIATASSNTENKENIAFGGADFVEHKTSFNS